LKSTDIRNIHFNSHAARMNYNSAWMFQVVGTTRLSKVITDLLNLYFGVQLNICTNL